MQLEVRVDNKGQVEGTVGWLKNKSPYIAIGRTCEGKQAAWLKDAHDNTIFVLAIRGYIYDGTMLTMLEPSADMVLYFSDIRYFAVTKSCWKAVKDIRNHAISILNEMWEGDREIDVAFSEAS
jgi:hypothetical protein